MFSVLGNATGSSNINQVVEETQPHTLGASHSNAAQDAERNQIDLPSQRG